MRIENKNPKEMRLRVLCGKHRLMAKCVCDFAEGAKMATTVWCCYPIEMVQVGVALEHSGAKLVDKIAKELKIAQELLD